MSYILISILALAFGFVLGALFGWLVTLVRYGNMEKQLAEKSGLSAADYTLTNG